jgi:hypothetical protein
MELMRLAPGCTALKPVLRQFFPSRITMSGKTPSAVSFLTMRSMRRATASSSRVSVLFRLRFLTRRRTTGGLD